MQTPRDQWVSIVSGEECQEAENQSREDRVCREETEDVKAAEVYLRGLALCSEAELLAHLRHFHPSLIEEELTRWRLPAPGLPSEPESALTDVTPAPSSWLCLISASPAPPSSRRPTSCQSL